MGVYLITFESFKDREEVLQSSLVSQGRSPVTVTEDLSQKTREARQELRRFMREVRRINPEKRCFLKYDKLFISGKMFVYSEVEGRVVEHAEVEQWRSMENLDNVWRYVTVLFVNRCWINYFMPE